MEIDSRTLALDHTSLSYQVSGSDPTAVPTVFLHPWFGCWQFWTTTMQALAPRRCYAVDLYSPSTGQDWTAVAGPTGLAEAVLAMLDAEGLDQVDLVGNSVGGIVAQVIASTAPQRVRRLILVGTGASTAGTLPGFAAAVDRWTVGIRNGAEASRAAVEDTVGMLLSAPPPQRDWETYVQAVLRTDPAYLAAVLGAARALDLTSRLQAIAAPTLIVRGSADCARTADHVAVLESGIPHSRSVEMPGAGHSPMVDHPAEFIRLVTGHLDGVLDEVAG